MRGDTFLSEALAKLPAAGFRKQRDYFYLVEEPNLLVVYRKYNGAAFEGYYLAYTHTFFSNVKDPGGRFVIPTLLEGYPISLSIAEIQAQFRKHPTIELFDCNLNFVSREMTRTRPPPRSSWLPKWLNATSWLKRSGPANGYLKDPVAVVLQEGLRFMREFSPAFTHQVLTKCTGLSHPTLDKLTVECKQFLNSSNNQC